MSECQDFSIRELLPEYVHGALDDAERARVQAHVEWCVECADELTILQTVLATASAPTVDVARIVAAVPQYRPQAIETDEPTAPIVATTAPRLTIARGEAASTTRPVLRRPWYHNTSMRVAAGFLLAAVGVSGVAISHRVRQSGTPAHTQGQTAGHVQTTDNGVSLVGVSDLSDDNLEQLIQSMDDLDANPPADPDPDPAFAVSVGGGSA